MKPNKYSHDDEAYDLDNIYNEEERYYVEGYTNTGFLMDFDDHRYQVIDDTSIWYS